MIVELAHEKTRRVLPLAEAVPLACAATAVLAGASPGRVWVDRETDPRAALVLTPEGYYVLGEPLEAFAASLNGLIDATLAPGGSGESWWWFYLRCPDNRWVEALREALPDDNRVEKPREFYACTAETYVEAPEELLPDEYALKAVDAALLGRKGLKHLDQVQKWGQGGFGSREAFLENGFGAVALAGDAIASMCIADNACDSQCEVGVRTLEDYRRLGLATCTVSAATGWALSNGFESVGWHCLSYNVASAATAKRVGYRKISDYTAIKVTTHLVDAHLLKGNLCLLDRDFGAAAEWYQAGLHAFIRGAPSHLLGNQKALARYAYQTACARALADESAPAPEALRALLTAIEDAGLRPGGY